jgi:hypothetical protein
MKFFILFISLFIVSSLLAQKLPEIEIGGVGVYPNPFNDELFIKSENQVDKIEIFNEQGLKVLSVNQNNVIDANRLMKGNYVLKLYFKDQIIVRKVVKK